MDKDKKIKKLKEEINMLELLISFARPEEWDMEGALDELTTEEYPESFIQWFTKRFHLSSKG